MTEFSEREEMESVRDICVERLTEMEQERDKAREEADYLRGLIHSLPDPLGEDGQPTFHEARVAAVRRRLDYLERAKEHLDKRDAAVTAALGEHAHPGRSPAENVDALALRLARMVEICAVKDSRILDLEERWQGLVSTEWVQIGLRAIERVSPSTGAASARPVTFAEALQHERARALDWAIEAVEHVCRERWTSAGVPALCMAIQQRLRRRKEPRA